MPLAHAYRGPMVGVDIARTGPPPGARARTPARLLRWTAALWIPALAAVTVAAAIGYGVGDRKSVV